LSEENIKGEIEETQEEAETTQTTAEEEEEPLQTEEPEISEEVEEDSEEIAEDLESTESSEEPEETVTADDDSIEESEAEEDIEETEDELEETVTSDDSIEESEAEEDIEEADEELVEAEPVTEAEEIAEEEDEVEDVSEDEEADKEIELDIPAIPLPDEDSIDEDKLADMDDAEEHTFEATEIKEPKKKKKKKKKRSPSFWIGLGIGLVIAIVAEILFTIPFWKNGAGSPDLYYIELVVILIALMIPGLASRSIQKGLIGALIIFAVTFALPFVTMLFNWPLLNPLTPLYASTDFALGAYEAFQSLFSVDFDFAVLQTWVWIIDLVLMFILMVIVVTIAAALTKNIAKPKKKVGNWIGIPLLSIGLIIFAVFTPILFSSTYGIIQASTAFLAGSSHLTTAFTSFDDISDNPSILEENIEGDLLEAGYWFNISQLNYQGLRNIGVINFAVLVSGQYGPLIEAGDQLALATLSFTHVLYPLFSGIYQLTNSFNNATGSMADFGQSGSASLYIDDPNPMYIADNITNTDDLRDSIRSAIEGMESAQESLNYVLEVLEAADVSGSFDEVAEALEGLDLTALPAKVSDVVTQIQDNLGEFQGQIEGLQSFVSFANESLTPTKDILWVAYYALVGNDYLKNYRFADAYDAYENATIKIDEIQASGGIQDFDAGSLGEIFAVEITDDFSLMLTDLLNLMDPLLNEQKSFASTFIGITNVLGIFSALGNDILAVDYTTSPMPAIIADATDTETFGGLADIAATAFRDKIVANEYGSIFNDIGADFESTLIGDFKPKEFGNYTVYLADATDLLWTACDQYKATDFVNAQNTMDTAENILVTDVFGSLDTDLIPDYFESYLIAWRDALTAISNAMDALNDANISAALGQLQIDVQETA